MFIYYLKVTIYSDIPISVKAISKKLVFLWTHFCIQYVSLYGWSYLNISLLPYIDKCLDLLPNIDKCLDLIIFKTKLKTKLN